MELLFQRYTHASIITQSQGTSPPLSSPASSVNPNYTLTVARQTSTGNRARAASVGGRKLSSLQSSSCLLNVGHVTVTGVRKPARRGSQSVTSTSRPVFYTQSRWHSAPCVSYEVWRTIRKAWYRPTRCLVGHFSLDIPSRIFAPNPNHKPNP